MTSRTLVPLLLAALAVACGTDPDDGPDMDGGMVDGGSDAGPEDGGTEPAACADRTGGALVTLDIVDETLTVWITNDVFIEEAVDQLEGEARRRVPSFNELHEGTDCDPQWSWHPDPEDLNWADATIELCDGVPSFVEDELEYWLTTVDQYCPWDATVAAVDDRR